MFSKLYFFVLVLTFSYVEYVLADEGSDPKLTIVNVYSGLKDVGPPSSIYKRSYSEASLYSDQHGYKKYDEFDDKEDDDNSSNDKMMLEDRRVRTNNGSGHHRYGKKRVQLQKIKNNRKTKQDFYNFPGSEDSSEDDIKNKIISRNNKRIENNNRNSNRKYFHHPSSEDIFEKEKELVEEFSKRYSKPINLFDLPTIIDGHKKNSMKKNVKPEDTWREVADKNKHYKKRNSLSDNQDKKYNNDDLNNDYSASQKVSFLTFKNTNYNDDDLTDEKIYIENLDKSFYNENGDEDMNRDAKEIYDILHKNDITYMIEELDKFDKKVDKRNNEKIGNMHVAVNYPESDLNENRHVILNYNNN